MARLGEAGQGSQRWAGRGEAGFGAARSGAAPGAAAHQANGCGMTDGSWAIESNHLHILPSLPGPAGVKLLQLLMTGTMTITFRYLSAASCVI
jgi:hypothetical protein